VKEKKVTVSKDPPGRAKKISASEHRRTPVYCTGVATIGADRPGCSHRCIIIHGSIERHPFRKSSRTKSNTAIKTLVSHPVNQPICLQLCFFTVADNSLLMLSNAVRTSQSSQIYLLSLLQYWFSRYREVSSFRDVWRYILRNMRDSA
jgi:hypothetical protein